MLPTALPVSSNTALIRAETDSESTILIHGYPKDSDIIKLAF